MLTLALLNMPMTVVMQVQENPGCVERVLCESYKKGEALSGLPYVIWTFIK